MRQIFTCKKHSKQWNTALDYCTWISIYDKYYCIYLFTGYVYIYLQDLQAQSPACPCYVLLALFREVTTIFSNVNRKDEVHSRVGLNCLKFRKRSPVFVYIINFYFFTEVEVIIGEYLPWRSRSKCVFTDNYQVLV